MGFLGLDFEKLLVIAVFAFIVFGPEKLSEVMAEVGRAVRQFRRLRAGLTEEFERAVGDPAELRRALTGASTGMAAQVTGVAESVGRDLAAGVPVVSVRPGVPLAANGQSASVADAVARSRQRRQRAGYGRPADRSLAGGRGI